MKTKAQLQRRLKRVEAKMRRQVDECSYKGWDSYASLFWNGRCVERRTLRYVLQLKFRPFCAADTMAGW